MGVKVKCEHCWKLFEVPDDAINTQRQCHFCQRTTLAKPIIDEEKTEIVEENGIPEGYHFFRNIIFIMLFISLMNFLLLFRGAYQEDRVKEILQETPEWQAQIQNTVSKMEEKVKEYEDILKQNKIESFTPEALAIYLIRSMESSIKLLHERILQQKNALKQLQDKLNNMEINLQKIRQNLGEKNEKR